MQINTIKKPGKPIKNRIVASVRKIVKKIRKKIFPHKHPLTGNNFNDEGLPKKRNWKFFIMGVLFAISFIAVPYEIYKWFGELPSPDLLRTNGSIKSTRINDSKGRLLYEIYVDRNYNPVPFEKIPKVVKDATLAAEDSSFYEHKGIRFDSILRAAKETFISGNVQGGSTITQQLVKNVMLTPERTFERKIKEAVLAIWVEKKYSKNEIFGLYLNNIPYGGTAWGVQSASIKYFGKNVWDLSLAEAALLAGLPSSPSSYSPIYDLELAKERQKYVLDKMVDLGFIKKEDADKAYEQQLVFTDQKEFIRAPHFVAYVRKELEKTFGRRLVDYGGLEVTTTLDLDLQDYAQEVIKAEVAKGTNLKFSNGAAIVLDVKNNGILAYIGSIDYFRDGWGSYDVVTAYRQPGSSIKPVTYALALSTKYTAASYVKDEPVSFPVPGSPAYSPVNYDGKYHGEVTVRQALANSYNIPAVRIAQVLGPDNIVSFGKDLGLQNWNVDNSYGLSVTLGGKEVRLLDLANVYSTFARGGEYQDITPFVSVKDAKGNELYRDNYRKRKNVLSSEVAYLIWNILSDNNARLPAFGVNNFLTVPGKLIAVKTGTTDSKKDNWTFGFTPSYVVGVWVGNNDNTPMNPYLASGLTGAAPIWNKIFSKILNNVSNEPMQIPSGITFLEDKKCNRKEVFIKGSNIPKSLCSNPDTEKNNSKKNKH